MNYYKSQLLNIDNDTLKVNSEGKLYAEIQTSDELINDENSSSSTTYSSEKIETLIPSEYELPIASSSILGGVKVDGTTINIDSNGIISAETSSIGELNDLDDVSLSNLNNNQILSYDGTSHRWINKNFSEYELPIASTSILGGVKVDGTTIDIDNNGVISATAQEINVDSELDIESENPVQNKVISEALESIEVTFGDDIFMSSKDLVKLFNTEDDEYIAAGDNYSV